VRLTYQIDTQIIKNENIDRESKIKVSRTKIEKERDRLRKG